MPGPLIAGSFVACSVHAATHDEITAHIQGCPQAQALDREVLESSGYKAGVGAAAPPPSAETAAVTATGTGSGGVHAEEGEAGREGGLVLPSESVMRLEDYCQTRVGVNVSMLQGGHARSCHSWFAMCRCQCRPALIAMHLLNQLEIGFPHGHVHTRV